MAGDRPGVGRWVAYAYGRRLPPRYAQWVLADLTGKWWFVRHMLRGLAQCAPALLLLLFPAPASILAMMVAIVVFGAEFYSMAFAWEIRDRRLYQHGYVPELVLRQDDGADDADDDA